MKMVGPMMSDRDFVLKFTLKHTLNGFICVTNSVERPDVPPKKGIVRAEMFEGF
jgi:hypothetical protein